MKEAGTKLLLQAENKGNREQEKDKKEPKRDALDCTANPERTSRLSNERTMPSVKEKKRLKFHIQTEKKRNNTSVIRLYDSLSRKITQRAEKCA